MKTIDEIRRQNLQIAVQRFGTASALAEAAGVAAAYLSQIKNQNQESKTGKPKAMGDEVARKIESALGETEGWMDADHLSKSTGVSDSHKSAEVVKLPVKTAGGRDDDEEPPTPTADEYVLVPQLDIAASCGSGHFDDHVVIEGGRAFPRKFLSDLGVPERAARLIYAAGGSMDPTIHDGRAVLINTADTEPVDNGIYAICMPHDGLMLKRLAYDYHPASGAMVWIIRSDNPDKAAFPDRILPPDERTRIAGRAKWTDVLL